MSTTTRPLALVFQALLVALVSFGATTAVGAPDDPVAKARKDLKKNAKKLGQLDAALAAKQAELAQILGAPKIDENKQRAAEEEIVKLRDAGGEVIGAVATADNGDAAELLVAFAVATQSEDLYERIRGDLTRLVSDEAVQWMATTLGQGVMSGEDGEKRRGGGNKRGGDDAWKAQVLIAKAFDGISHDATIPPLVAQIEKGTNSIVVNACVETARRKQDKRLIPALIAMLGRVERQGGLEYHQVRQALVDQTGEDFFTEEKWKEWWAANAETFGADKKGQAREAATKERAKEEAIPAFFGSEIASNRVCFIIDTSGSMTMTDKPSEDSRSEEEFAKLDPDSPEIKPLKRIERARKALVDCIKSLQPTQRFNVIAFSSGNRVWRSDRAGNPTVVEANEANKADALKFVEALKDDGGTETYKALEAAFKDPLIDTIYLLSDGAPNAGKLGNPGEQMRQFARAEVTRCLDLVKRENRFKGIKIHTFGMDGPGVWHHKWGLPRPVTLPIEPEWLSILSGFMRELASITGGDSKSI